MQKNNLLTIFLSVLLCSSMQSAQANEVSRFFSQMCVAFAELFSEEQVSHQNQQPKQPSQPSKHFQQQSPDFKVLYSELEPTFKQFADIDNQSGITREQLYSIKKEVIEAVKEKNFKTHAEARKMAFDQAPSQILEFLVKKAGDTAEQEIKDPAKKQQARNVAEQHFRNVGFQKISNNQSIGNLLLNVKPEVIKLLNANFPSSQRPQNPHATVFEHNQYPVSFHPQESQHSHDPYAASAPSLNDLNNSAQSQIKEILPQGEPAKTLAEFEPKTATKHIIYQDECCNCKEEFTGIGKRVTLRCGDQICPKCLLAWKFSQAELQKKYNKPIIFTCPFCVRNISEDDFSADYISSKL